MNATPSKQPTEPTVYICEQMAFDYTPATVYGSLKFIEAKPLAPQSPGAPDTWNKGVIHQLRKELSGYIPGYDYVIPTGSPSRMLTVGMVLTEKGPSHRILKWDGRAQRYLLYDVAL
jgi:hypothetical protein